MSGRRQGELAQKGQTRDCSFSSIAYKCSWAHFPSGDLISTAARNRVEAPAAVDATASVSRATAIALSSVCLVMDVVFWFANVRDIINHEDPASLVIRQVAFPNPNT